MKNVQDLAAYIDHTLLSPTALEKDFIKLAEEASLYRFKSICIPPCWVEAMANRYREREFLLCTVVGFPLGYQTLQTKVAEVIELKDQGADEFDMVLNIGNLLDKNYSMVQEEIEAVVEAAEGACVKVIFETCLLGQEDIRKATEICVKAKATFVKTSTGFSKHGATIDAVETMLEAAQGKIQIKASGGIKDKETALLYIEKGVTRIGTSSGIKILN